MTEVALGVASAWLLIGAFMVGIYAVAIKNEGEFTDEHFGEAIAILILWPFWVLFALGVVFADRVLHLIDKEPR